MKRFKRAAAVLTASAAVSGGAWAVLATAGPAQAGASATATVRADGTAVRVAADLGAPIRTRLPLGTPVKVQCQAIGTTTEVSGFGTSPLWDYLPAFSGWASDVLIDSKGAVNACTKAHGTATLLDRARKAASARLDIHVNPFAGRYADQCTYYAESRMAQQTGKFMPVYGNAYQWASQAKVGGWTVGAIPAVNSVAVFPRNAFGSPNGHVAWVSEVNGRQVRIQDYNWNGAGASVTDHWVHVVPGTQFIYADR